MCTKLNNCKFLVVALAAVLIPATGMPGFAQSSLLSQAEWEQLSELAPGLSVEELERQIVDWAKANRQEPAEVVKQMLGDARKAKEEARAVEAEERSIGRKGNEDVGLPKAREAGDVFYTPSKTSGFRHGHSGIYVAPEVIIEAPGRGKVAHKINIEQTDYPKKRVWKQYVVTTPKRRAAAAQKAHHYIGHPYNDNFLLSKVDDGTPKQPVNCSQLVWLSYFMSYPSSVPARQRVDLDKNGGPGVYPWDIRDSPLTVKYN